MSNTPVNKYSLIFVIVVAAALGYFFSDRFFETDVSQPGNVTSAEPVAKKAGPHRSYDPHASLTPEKHIQVALQHKQEGRLSEAMRTLDAAIMQYGNNKDLYAVRGSIYLEQERPAMALRDFELALIIAPDDSTLLTNRAQVYRQFGQIKQALADLDKAITLSPDLVAARFNRGAIYYSSGDYQQALDDFDQCIATDPHLAGPYFNRASAKHALGNIDGARADINRFIQISQSETWKATAQDLLQRWDEQKSKQGNEAAKS